MDEKELIRTSALLCKKWNDLRNEIANKQSQLKKEVNAQKCVEEDAKKYMRNKKGNVFLFLMRILLLYLIIPALPILIIYLAYINNVGLDFIKKYGPASSVLTFALFVIDVIIDSSISKAKDKKTLKKYIDENINKYIDYNQQVKTENARIISEIDSLKIELNKLEEIMNNREICCIHPDYWYAGSQLYYLIDCNRADNLKEAINLFENIKENERRRLAEEAAAEERRWAKIEDMMNESERMETLKRTIRSAVDDAFFN